MEKKKRKFSVRRLIYNDKYLIIVSIILAFVVWIFASINIGTDEVKTITVDVPITLGDEMSEQLGMQYYSLQDNIELKVTISGPKYVIGQATSNDLSVNFDTSSVNRTGSQSIPILVTNSSKTLDFDVTSTYPSSIDAYFDVNKSKIFDLSLQFDENAVAEGYSFGTPVLSEDKVVISGPQTYVDKIDKALLRLDFNSEEKLTEPYNADCRIEIQGSGVETSYLTMTSRTDAENKLSKVAVVLPVLKNTRLPVTIDFEDEPYYARNSVSVWYSQKELNAGVLDSADISQAVIGTVNFKDLKVGRNEFTFDVANLQGITVLDDVTQVDVVVTVSGDYEMHEIPIDVSSVLADGVPKGFKASVNSIDNSVITVVAPKGTELTANDLSIKCDVSKVKKNHNYPADITIVNNNKAWVYGDYKVNVTLTKIET